MKKQKGEIEKHRQRLVELITLFSRCRQNLGIVNGCGGGKSVCSPCPYEKEHSEMWNILGEDDFIFKSGIVAVDSLLPEDVRIEMHRIPDHIYATAWRILYNALGERMQQDELDLMDTVLASVVAEEKDREQMRADS